MHIGIIMDGNGRWATQQGKPRLYGHKHGIENVIRIVKECPSLGIDTVTLFAFAIANWKRDKEEVDGLWALFHVFFESQLQELVRSGTRIICIGNRAGLPEMVLEKIVQIEKESEKNAKNVLQIALNYDGVDEVARMVKTAITTGVTPEEITPEYIHTHLDTLPNSEPDIMLRTGMEIPEATMSLWRGSAFLPMQSAQSVCVSSVILWPAFTKDDLQKVIEYAKPETRLFGGQRK